MGRLKAATFVGYAVAAVVRPLLAITAAWWQILLVRFGDRLGKAVRGAPRDRLIADAAPPEIRGRAFGYHSGMDNAGALGGPLIVYWMLALGMKPRNIFAWTVVPGLLSLLILGAGVQETKSIGREKIEVGIPDAPRFRRLLAVIFVFTLGSSSDSFLQWRAREVGVSAAHLPLLWFILAFIRVSSSTPGGELSDRWGRHNTIISEWLLYSAVYLGFAFVSAPRTIWLLFAVYGLFSGLTEGSERALVIDLVAEEWRGRALGAYKAAVGIALLPASVFFGVVYQQWGAQPAFILGAALALIAIFLLPASAPLAKPPT
jgi:MFS family permease